MTRENVEKLYGKPERERVFGDGRVREQRGKIKVPTLEFSGNTLMEMSFTEDSGELIFFEKNILKEDPVLFLNFIEKKDVNLGALIGGIDSYKFGLSFNMCPLGSPDKWFGIFAKGAHDALLAEARPLRPSDRVITDGDDD
ncbi:hypothetical protein [Acetobacter aceti]|nr:hypothetical protein [Acetobacter aceti]